MDTDTIHFRNAVFDLSLIVDESLETLDGWADDYTTDEMFEFIRAAYIKLEQEYNQ